MKRKKPQRLKMAELGTHKFPSIKDFAEWLKSFSLDFVILECVDSIEIEKFQFDADKMIFNHKNGTTTNLNDWDNGIAFSTECEIRWTRIENDQCLARIITEKDHTIPSDFNSKNIRDYNQRQLSDVYLWGRYDNTLNAWREDRIPKLLYYPDNVTESPRLTVNEYRKLWWEDDVVKEEIFYRFITLR